MNQFGKIADKLFALSMETQEAANRERPATLARVCLMERAIALSEAALLVRQANEIKS